ncbi:MAG: hypothetical protein PHV43_02395 [Candidatus Colwellbacteria bacterium]|nr:hypothetical protein [Candidatus Colwellbacteria bacterium]
MIKKKEGQNNSIDRWLFIISGMLVAGLLIIAIATIVFLSGQIFQSFSPVHNDEEGLRYNLEGYKKLNPSMEGGGA